jgi:PadR family transcriptional regulator, regulatory protein PadR
MKLKRSNPDFLNGVPELLVLNLLSAKPMYGYELVQAIAAATGGHLEFGEGCIYSLLHKLEADRLLTSRRELVAGRSRVVYQLAPQGRKRFSESLQAWKQIVAAVTQAIEGDRRAIPALD